MLCFKILETKNSKANERKIFIQKYSTYTPDFFIIFFYTTLLIFSSFSDLILLIFLFSNASIIIWILFLIFSYSRLVVEFVLEIKSPKSSNDQGRNFFQDLYKLLLMIFGLHSILTVSDIIKGSFENLSTPDEYSDCRSYSFFRISSENLSLIKYYCHIYVGFKSIPQLFIVSVFTGMSHPSGFLAGVSTVNLVLNMVLFSFTMSITFPIRKTPRIFDHFYSLIFSAFNKFMATLSGCCVNLLVFMVTYRYVKCYAFLAHFLKTVIWVLPCQALLSAQPISKLEFLILMAFFPLVFSFIFIHPFEKTWRLFYYLSYLLTSLLDLAFLGVWTDAEVLDLSYYSTLRIAQMAFLSFFGLFNSILKGEDCQEKEKVVEPNAVDEPKDTVSSQASNSREIKKEVFDKKKSKSTSRTDIKKPQN